QSSKISRRLISTKIDAGDKRLGRVPHSLLVGFLWPLLGKWFNMTNIWTDDDGTRLSMPRLLSIRDVADILGVSPRTVQRLISSRKLPAYRIRGFRRIALSDVKKLLREHRDCGRKNDDDEYGEDDEDEAVKADDFLSGHKDINKRRE